MISLKAFHLFFIFISIVIMFGYGFYEILSPKDPGFISYIAIFFSLSTVILLIFYLFRVIRKFRTL